MAEPKQELALCFNELSSSLGVTQYQMLETIKAQCFPGFAPAAVSDAQLITFVQVANALKVNPLLPGMLYAYKGQNGAIIPMIGPDGVFSSLANHPDIKGWKVEHTTIDDDKVCIATITHARLGEITKTCFLSEWAVRANPNWTSRPRHMLEIRTIKQCARQVIHGIPFDEDEKRMADLYNVTPPAGDDDNPTDNNSLQPQGDNKPATRRARIPGKKGVAAADKENLPETVNEAVTIDANVEVVGDPSPEADPAAAKKAAEEEAKAKKDAEAKAKADEDAAAKKAADAKRVAEEKAAREKEAAALAEQEAAAQAKAKADAEKSKPEPTNANPVNPVSAEAGAPEPRYPQPPGYPIETTCRIKSVVKRKSVKYGLRDGTVLPEVVFHLMELEGPDVTAGKVSRKVYVDPENFELCTLANQVDELNEPSEEIALTVEVWPSAGDPSKVLCVATFHEEVASL